jgi:2-polyprenyl-6-methoxyphenol hydroxylase-like FAD-dependent oxidoreductase
MDTDVLVVGAGPTGLMLACQLVRRGARVRIIDRHAGPARETRALGVQARTLEIYAALGIADEAVALGKKGTGANLWAQGSKLARVPLGDAGHGVTPYPYILVLGQDDNELLLGRKLAELGGRVEWNTELVGLRQEAEHAAATLKLADGGTHEIRTSWVAGCDGAHSAVRKLNDIPFPGEPYEHVFFVADAEATGTMVPDEVNVYLWREGFHLLFPMRGRDHWRIVGIVPEHLRGRDDLGLDALMPSLHSEAGPALDIRSCSWFSTYRIHHRAASRFRDGRCFLLGDAAHIHSPVGAQGMNTGLQDAYNLAWKLALVVGGAAAPTLLNTYEEERLPVARRLLNTTDRAFKLVVADSWLAGLFRTRVLARIAAFAMSRPAVQGFAFRVVSQTGIRYRSSRLSVFADTLPKQAPQPGDRFPWLRLRFGENTAAEDVFARLDDTRFNLLLIGQESAAVDIPETNEVVRVHLIPAIPANATEFARVHIPVPAFYLLRPDGHVGLCGSRWDSRATEKYAEETLLLGKRAFWETSERFPRQLTGR